MGGMARRHGDHAVHLFPAGGGDRSPADLGRNHLRARTPRHVPRRSRFGLRSAMGPWRVVWPGASASRGRVLPLQLRRRRDVRSRPPLRDLRARGSSAPRPRAPPAGLRLLPEMLAPVQCAGRPGRDQRDRTHVLSGSAARHRPRGGRRLSPPARGPGACARRNGAGMTHALLFEVGTEELPPSELPPVLRGLEDGARRLLAEARLACGALRVYSTPRRLALAVSDLAERQERQTVRVTGPPKSAAFDASGAPTRAATGFARAQGVGVEQLRTVVTERGEYLAAEREEGGQAASAVLPALLERLIESLAFAKQMRWGEGDVRFSRPVRWVVVLLDDAVLPVTVAGVSADRITYGHRFLAPPPIRLASAGEYLSRVGEAHVMAEVDARRAEILRQIEAEGARHGVQPVIDEATLEAVIHLVEWPMAVVGALDPAFLELPRPVVETPIRHHQRCFTAERPDASLAPFFVAISNMPGRDPSEIRSEEHTSE